MYHEAVPQIRIGMKTSILTEDSFSSLSLSVCRPVDIFFFCSNKYVCWNALCYPFLKGISSWPVRDRYSIVLIYSMHFIRMIRKYLDFGHFNLNIWTFMSESYLILITTSLLLGVVYVIKLISAQNEKTEYQFRISVNFVSVMEKYL